MTEKNVLVSFKHRSGDNDTDVASVESKADITEDEKKVLRKFGIVYGVL